MNPWATWERILRLGRPESVDTYVWPDGFRDRRWHWSVRVEGRTVRRGTTSSKRAAQSAARAAADDVLGL